MNTFDVCVKQDDISSIDKWVQQNHLTPNRKVSKKFSSLALEHCLCVSYIGLLEDVRLPTGERVSFIAKREY